MQEMSAPPNVTNRNRQDISLLQICNMPIFRYRHKASISSVDPIVCFHLCEPTKVGGHESFWVLRVRKIIWQDIVRRNFGRAIMKYIRGRKVQMTDSSAIKTGVPGLDEILLGGIPRGNVILLQGVAGSGKTIMGIEMIYHGIASFDEPGLIVVFETSPDKVIRDTSKFGWDLEKMQRDGKLQIIFASPQVFDQELRSADSLLMQAAKEIGARRIFIDGVGVLEQITAVGRGEPISYRKLLRQLIEAMNRENLTAILSHEIGNHPDSLALVEAADFLADTVIQLNRERQGSRSLRSVEILKSRGQDFESGEHSLHITDGKGLEVFRRVQAPTRRYPTQATSSTKRAALGVDAVDSMIEGGFYDGSTTMVIGVSGVGKTVLSTQLLLEGSLKHKRRGLMVSLDEHPAQIVRNGQSIGLDLQGQIDAGEIRILFESPQELDIDAHYAKIIGLVEEHDIQRMVIDGMTSYSTALGNMGLYRDFFHALVDYSKNRSMTTFFNYENPEFLGISSFMPDFPVNSIVDNLILMSIVEIDDAFHRCISVVKARGSDHSFQTREFAIGPGGITLVPLGESAEVAAALQDYSSLLGRAPTRLRRIQKTKNGELGAMERVLAGRS
jgi:circadian clock protein KaiC